MTYDSTTPVKELIEACDYSVVSELLGMEEYEDADAKAKLAAAELTRRSELAEKYERLTQALYLASCSFTDNTGARPEHSVLISVPALGDDWEDEGGDGIVAAIIAAAEGAK